MYPHLNAKSGCHHPLLTNKVILLSVTANSQQAISSVLRPALTENDAVNIVGEAMLGLVETGDFICIAISDDAKWQCLQSPYSKDAKGSCHTKT